MHSITSPAHQQAARRLKQLYSRYQRNRDLISFGTGPPGQQLLDKGWQYAAGVQYGLDRRTVIGASGHSSLRSMGLI